MLGPRQSEFKVLGVGSSEWVILLNGIGPQTFSIASIAPSLLAAGFSVAQLVYPSTMLPLQRLSDEVIAPMLERFLPPGVEKLHFVTLSMGGIVARVFLRDHRPQNLGRVVMLAPPNQGSEVSDFLQRFSFYRLGMGPAGLELTTAANSTVNQLPPVDFPCGIIAGQRCLDPWFAWLFKGPNDGKVSVERAKVAGMTDFRVIDGSHYFIMRHPQAQELTIRFLQTGDFGPVPPVPKKSTKRRSSGNALH